jgi:hypothetical protein
MAIFGERNLGEQRLEIQKKLALSEETSSNIFNEGEASILALAYGLLN